MTDTFITADTTDAVALASLDRVVLLAGVNLTVASPTDAAISAIGITANLTDVVIAGSVYSSDGGGVLLTGTSDGTLDGFGGHRVEVMQSGSVFSFGTAITTEGSANNVFVDGDLSAKIAVSNTGDLFRLDNTADIYAREIGVSLFQSANSDVDNSGTIQGDDVGLKIEDSRKTNISNSGSISSDIDGIQMLRSNGSTLSNSGSIAADGNGVVVDGAAKIFNTGEIIAGSDAIAILGSDNVRIVNSGTITGQSMAIKGGAGRDSVVNINLIDGNVFLGKSDDTYLGGTNSLVKGSVSGGDGMDRLTGGSARDEFLGGAGDDILSGRLGDDLLMGGKNDDTIRGGGGDDTLQGDNGEDILKGNKGHDLLTGGKGNDTLQGDSGFDSLDGGDGRDILNGGRGNDTLTGGAGDDRFVFGNTAPGNDVITDFQAGADKIDLSAYEITFDDILNAATNKDSDVIINLSLFIGRLNSITIESLSVELLSETDFIL